MVAFAFAGINPLGMGVHRSQNPGTDQGIVNHHVTLGE